MKKAAFKRLAVVALAAVMTVGGAITAMAGEWKPSSSGWWYLRDDNSYPTGEWEQIDGKWYYFDREGYMMTNAWIDTSGKSYYVGADGAMCVNQMVDGHQVGADGAKIGETNGTGIYVYSNPADKSVIGQNGAVMLDYKVNTPLITIFGNQSIANTINDKIAEMNTEFETQNAQIISDAQAGRISGATLSRNFEVMGIATKHISIKFTDYVFTGGAHGNTNVWFVTFNTKDGSIVNFDDMAVNPDNLKNTILNYAAGDIASRGIDNDPAIGDKVRAAGIEQWCPVEGGMTVLYNQYSIASYAAGQIESFIPYKEYSMYLNELGRNVGKFK